MNRPHKHRRPNCQAFTLVELLVSLAIATLIGAASILMLTGVVSAANRGLGVHQAQAEKHVVAERLSALVRASRLVLSTSSDSVLLWRSDASGNGSPNLSELILIKWNSGTSEVCSYQLLQPPSDLAYALNANFLPIATQLASASTPRVLLRNIRGCTIQHSVAQIQARTLKFQLDLDNEPQPLILIASLRAG